MAQLWNDWLVTVRRPGSAVWIPVWFGPARTQDEARESAHRSGSIRPGDTVGTRQADPAVSAAFCGAADAVALARQ